jgi:argininosuccinate lyase
MLDRRERFPTVAYATFGEAFEAVTGRPPRLGEADLRRFTTPEHFVSVRTLPGGPAPGPLGVSFARYRRGVRRRPRVARRLPGADRGRGSSAC